MARPLKFYVPKDGPAIIPAVARPLLGERSHISQCHAVIVATTKVAAAAHGAAARGPYLDRPHDLRVQDVAWLPLGALHRAGVVDEDGTILLWSMTDTGPVVSIAPDRGPIVIGTLDRTGYSGYVFEPISEDAE